MRTEQSLTLGEQGELSLVFIFVHGIDTTNELGGWR